MMRQYLAIFLLNFIFFLLSSTESAAVALTQLKVTASDAAASDQFGGAVAIYDSLSVVGARFNDDAGNSSGSAYVFDVVTGQQLHKLTALDAAAGDWFGISVGVSGDKALVGAYQDDPMGNNSGSAYLFDVTTGSQVRKLMPADGSANDNFGISVGIDGTRAVVGAYQDDNRGSAYIFDANTGQQLSKFSPADLASSAYFGGDLAISGDLVVVAANSDDESGLFSGSAYLFDAVSGNQLFKLKPNDGAPYQQFGVSVDVHEDLVIVGTVNNSAYVFDALTGQQKWKLQAPDLSPGDRFGYSVAINGKYALVGAMFDSNPQGTTAGSTYIFDVTTGQLLHKLIAYDGAPFDQFGNDIAIHKSRLVVGAWFDNSPLENAGSAYFITVPEPPAFILASLFAAFSGLTQRVNKGSKYYLQFICKYEKLVN
jgi:outer membrane protein assembly factor BamB